MRAELEKRIFGYVDPEPPIPGSWKAQVFALVEQAEKISPEVLGECVTDLSKAVVRMRETQEDFMEEHFDLHLTGPVEEQ